MVPDDRLGSVILRGRVVRPDDEPARARLQWQRDGWPWALDLDNDPDSGRFELGPMTPGTFRLDVLADGSPPKSVPPRTSAPFTTLDYGDLRLPAPGAITLEATTAAGQRVTEASALLATDDGEPEAWRFHHDGSRWVASDLAPGEYTVWLCGEECVPWRASVVLHEGEQRLLRPSLLTGTPCRFTLQTSMADGADGLVHGARRILDGDGRPVFAEALFGPFADRMKRQVQRRLALPGGDYVVELTDRDAEPSPRSTRSRFTVPAHVDAPVEVIVRID